TGPPRPLATQTGGRRVPAMNINRQPATKPSTAARMMRLDSLLILNLQLIRHGEHQVDAAPSAPSPAGVGNHSLACDPNGHGFCHVTEATVELGPTDHRAGGTVRRREKCQVLTFGPHDYTDSDLLTGIELEPP